MLLDGAFGSLVVNGDPNFYKKHPNTSIYLANNPDLDKQIHRDYSKGASILSVHSFSLQDTEYLLPLCANAREVAGFDKQVALSLTEGADYYSMIELALPFIDYILLETYTSLSAIEEAVTVSLCFDKPIIANMVYGDYFSLCGDTVYDYFTRIGPYVEYIGFNCLTLDNLSNLLPQTVGYDYKLAVQPNTGIPVISEKITYPKFDFDKYISLIKDYNIELPGLCCGSTPQDIEKLHYLLNKGRV